MADAPWRCSQCGTVNEPAANACRTCGRWPSLFDLESNTVDQEPRREEPVERVDVYAPEETADVPVFEAEPYEAPSAELPPEFAAPETQAAEQESESRSGWRRFARFVVPVGIALYVLISALANRA